MFYELKNLVKTLATQCKAESVKLTLSDVSSYIKTSEVPVEQAVLKSFTFTVALHFYQYEIIRDPTSF